MFKLDMAAIRQSAIEYRLTANPANLAKNEPALTTTSQKISQLADLAISHPGTCNTQLSSITAHRLMKELIAAAMKACDHHHDGPDARQQMRADCLATPQHLRGDLLDHFQQTYPKAKS